MLVSLLMFLYIATLCIGAGLLAERLFRYRFTLAGLLSAGIACGI